MKRPAGTHVLIARHELPASDRPRLVGVLIEVPPGTDLLEAAAVAFTAVPAPLTAMLRDLPAEPGTPGSVAVDVGTIDYSDDDEQDQDDEDGEQ